MPRNTKVQDLKINVLTEAQYDAAVREEVIGDYELSLLTDMVDKAVQVESLPTASAQEEGNIYQYIGETDTNYTNGYFYKCEGSESVTTEIPEVTVLPSASAQEAGKIYHYVGETNSTYTNDKYYKCTSDGLIIDDWSSTEHETFSWKEVITDTSGIETVSELPEASEQELGNIYKQGDKYYKCTSFLMAADWGQPDVTAYKWSELETLNASNDAYSWVRIDVQPNQGGGIQSVTEGSENGTISVDGTDVNVHGLKSAAYAEATDYVAKTGDTMTGELKLEGIAPGRYENSELLRFTSKTADGQHINMTSIGMLPDDGNEHSLLFSGGLTLGGNLRFSNSNYSIGHYLNYVNRVVATKLNAGGDYRYANDIIIPNAGGKLSLQIDTMPTAAAKYLNVIYQFTGTTTSTYTNGHFYKCVTDGSTYLWEEVNFGGGAVIDDSTISTTATWSSSKINSMIGDIESLLAAI